MRTFARLAPYLGQVATRSYIANAKDTTNINVMSRTAHVAPYAITSLQTKFPNWYCGGTDNLLANALTYTASVEYPAGTFTQLTWSAVASVSTTSASIDTGLCDVATVSIPAGATFWIRNFCKTVSGTASGIPSTNSVGKWTASGEASAVGTTAITDQTMSGTVTDGGSVSVIFPLCIVATTSKASFGGLGDSRTLATTSGSSTPDSNGCQGQFSRPLGSSVPWLNVGVGGALLHDFNTSGAYRAALLQYTSHIINGFGINDLRAAGGNRTQAQLQADYFVTARRFPNKTVISTTISPQTSGTYTTTAGQTADGNASAITGFNSWVLAGTAPYTGYITPYAQCINIASITNYSGNPALWSVDAGSTALTSDGLHCNVTGYNDIVASGIVNPTTLGATAPVSQYSFFTQAVSNPVVWLDCSNPSTCPPSVSSVVSAGSSSTWPVVGPPTYSATGWNGAQATYNFNGTSQWMNTTANPVLNGAAGATLGAMFYLPSLPASGTSSFITVSVGGGQNERAAITVDSTGKLGIKYRRLDADAASAVVSASATSTSTPVLVTAVFDPSSTNKATLYVNGVQVAQGSFLSTGNYSATNSSYILIANNSGVFTALAMRELIVADSAFSTANRQKLEGDMAWRAGLAASLLPAGHPYLSAPPTN